MKNFNLKLAGTFAFFLFSISTFAQNWLVDGNTNAQLGGSLTPSIGTNQNRPLFIETNGIFRAEFTTNFALGVNTVIPGIGTGDGLRIIPRTSGCSSPSLSTATLDLWTSCSNGTNIRWDNSGQISGTNSRFEVWGNLNGF